MRANRGLPALAFLIAIGLGPATLADAPSGPGKPTACGWYLGQGHMPMMGRGQMPMMGYGQTPMMGYGQTPMMGYGQTPMMGYGQMPMMGYGQMPMMGYGQMPMMGYGQMPMMGYGQMPMMGYGQMPMMGQGSMMGYGHSRMPLRQDLSAAEVRQMLERQLAWQGNPNLKVGDVQEQDDDTIVADIVTKDGSLVQRFEVDRHSGFMKPVG